MKGRLGQDGSLEDLLQGAGSHEFPCRRHSSLYVVHKHCFVGHILHSYYNSPAASPYEHVDGWRGGHYFLALRRSSGISVPEEEGASREGLTSQSWASRSPA